MCIRDRLQTIDRLIPILKFFRKIGLDPRRKLFKEIHDALGGELWLTAVSYTHLDVYKRQEYGHPDVLSRKHRVTLK